MKGIAKFDNKSNLELVEKAAKLKNLDPRVYMAQASIAKAKADLKEGA